LQDLLRSLQKALDRKLSRDERTPIRRLLEAYASVVPSDFLPPVTENDLFTAMLPSEKKDWQTLAKIMISESRAKELAESLASSNLRPALHYEAYQEAAEGYEVIQTRGLADAEKDKPKETCHESNI
jgi:hypothetical protein